MVEDQRKQYLMLVSNKLAMLEAAKASWEIALVYVPERTPQIMLQMTIAAIITPLLKLLHWWLSR